MFFANLSQNVGKRAMQQCMIPMRCGINSKKKYTNRMNTVPIITSNGVDSRLLYTFPPFYF